MESHFQTKVDELEDTLNDRLNAQVTWLDAQKAQLQSQKTWIESQQITLESHDSTTNSIENRLGDIESSQRAQATWLASHDAQIESQRARIASQESTSGLENRMGDIEKWQYILEQRLELQNDRLEEMWEAINLPKNDGDTLANELLSVSSALLTRRTLSKHSPSRPINLDCTPSYWHV